MRTAIFTPLCIVIFMSGVGLFLPLARTPVLSQEKQSGDQASTVSQEIKAAARKFEEAFNRRDAKAIADLFTETAEVIDEDENVVKGRDLIQARFAESFKNFPDATIEIEVTSIKPFDRDFVIEEGISTVKLKRDHTPDRNRYSVIHLLRDGKWKFATVRDFPSEAASTAREHLEKLAWLVGHWVDESHQARVETSCRWSDDGNYLLQEYVARNREDRVLRGEQRIAYDPLRRTIRAWAFDQSGSFAESTWTLVEGMWVIKSEGVTSSGQAASATRHLTRLTDDAYQLDSTAQLVGNSRIPDTSIRVVRRPPSPME